MTGLALAVLTHMIALTWLLWSNPKAGVILSRYWAIPALNLKKKKGEKKSFPQYKPQTASGSQGFYLFLQIVKLKGKYYCWQSLPSLCEPPVPPWAPPGSLRVAQTSLTQAQPPEQPWPIVSSSYVNPRAFKKFCSTIQDWIKNAKIFSSGFMQRNPTRPNNTFFFFLTHSGQKYHLTTRQGNEAQSAELCLECFMF